MKILGISALYHDSAAALISDGKIVAAAQEERFTRKKHDDNFPEQAIRYCLREGGITHDGLDAVAFYDKPIRKFERILKTYFSIAPRGLRSALHVLPIWMKKKLWISLQIEESLEKLGIKVPADVFFLEHHQSHAGSAFFPSPFQRAAVLTIDGVGEWATSVIGLGMDNRVKIIKELRFPHSLGLLYSAFTYFTGFRVNSGEYKLMGLAPYGEPKYVDLIMKEIVDLKEDGSFRMNMKYFGYLDGMTMTNKHFDKLFGGPPRRPESPITQREMDIARSIQAVTEEIMLRMSRYAYEITGEDCLCLAGGVALNCVGNGRLLREGPFKDIWIQPAAGDAGGALGAALTAWHQYYAKPRQVDGKHDLMQGSYLGPCYSDDGIGAYLSAHGYPAQKPGGDAWADTIARLIDEGNVIGLLNGRMEFGPRALGNRSIIGDARSPRMQSIMNLKIKYRESFRPFAPSCLAEKTQEYFDLDHPSPYMLLVAQVQDKHLVKKTAPGGKDIKEIINNVRSDIPAITHVDNSARIQSVDAETNPGYYAIIRAFEKRTGCGVIINTSFNVRGEPIVCSPEDAYRCFMRTEMDYLVLGSWLLSKKDQPAFQEKGDWRKDYVLD